MFQPVQSLEFRPKCENHLILEVEKVYFFVEEVEQMMTNCLQVYKTNFGHVCVNFEKAIIIIVSGLRFVLFYGNFVIKLQKETFLNPIFYTRIIYSNLAWMIKCKKQLQKKFCISTLLFMYSYLYYKLSWEVILYNSFFRILQISLCEVRNMISPLT